MQKCQLPEQKELEEFEVYLAQKDEQARHWSAFVNTVSQFSSQQKQITERNTQGQNRDI